MVESRCGIQCSKCGFKETMGCLGCRRIKKPFWGEHCPVKDCCEEKKLVHCGECATFPCAILQAFAYDEKQGDNGLRIEQCRCWAKEEKANGM